MSRRDIGTDDPRVRVRPGKGSRPRSRNRPDYSAATVGMVIGVDRGRYQVALTSGTNIVAVRARELHRHPIVVGDQVRIVGDTSGAKDTLARIVQIQPRSSLLRRDPEEGDKAGVEKPIVANAQQLVIVTALANPTPRPGMIDRCLVAAYAGGLTPLLCLTKSDLASADEFLLGYSSLGIPVFQTQITSVSARDTGLDQVRAALTGKSSVLIGHSGVGKSTLINQLVPQAGRTTGVVNDVTGRGRHTSTSVRALALPQGGWVIDTPGVRSFGLAHVDASGLLHGFVDLDQASSQCCRGCDHSSQAPECGLDLWAGSSESRLMRVRSFRRLLAAKPVDAWRSS